MEGAIDIHVHILPEIDDDGPPDLQSSLELAEGLVRQGFAAVVATPHCYEGVPCIDEVEEHCRRFSAELEHRAIPLEVHPGAELALEPQLLKRLKSGQVPTLNRGPYLLVELPLYQEVPPYAEDLLFEMRAHGYYPILAHPERIKALQEDLPLLFELVTRGVYTQLTLSSFTGLKGPAAQKAAWKMLQHRLVHLLATDAHRAGRTLAQTGPAAELIRKKVGPEVLPAMLKERAALLLRGEAFEVPEPAPLHKSRFHRIKERISFNWEAGSALWKSRN